VIRVDASGGQIRFAFGSSTEQRSRGVQVSACGKRTAGPDEEVPDRPREMHALRTDGRQMRAALYIDPGR
jgi:hypothetical protein